ncbi:type II toxin-antitoxin system VapC family toxin [Caulobacter hibisci]|uniref:Ribonuclease VapC n=1 Tax=Caulobacter hibisci TaxID=2035993 RepID=A0ABS0SSR1_9CAUL|nr:type II toxin-antitoxin system VapC family toxin [Caulobacter hibisci]MBI1682613.1 type II toxin-antitoxin system VapC family toxin [Caulobacter hibisci]
MFVDASAWTAILLNEPEREILRAKLAEAATVLTSAISTWEAVRAVTRETKRPFADAVDIVSGLQESYEARIVLIGEAEQAIALEAHARFGKGVHPAKLNMGDCFAYACAKVHGVPLLYKGGDFSLTDIEAA